MAKPTPTRKKAASKFAQRKRQILILNRKLVSVNSSKRTS